MIRVRRGGGGGGGAGKPGQENANKINVTFVSHGLGQVRGRGAAAGRTEVHDDPHLFSSQPQRSVVELGRPIILHHEGTRGASICACVMW